MPPKTNAPDFTPAKVRRQIAKYIRDIDRGKIVSCRLVRFAIRRHQQDLREAKKRGYYFDENAAAEAVLFFPLVLRHAVGEWDNEPFVLSDWQAFIVWCLFGWRRRSDKTRRFRKAYISVARKNGKSTLVAGLALLLLCLDNPIEQSAECYIAATKEEQAAIIFRQAQQLRRKSPSIKNATQAYKKSITLPITDSFLRPIGSDSDTTDGLNPHAVLKDELHAWQARHRGLHEKLSTGGASRRQPIEVIITTAGDDRAEIWQAENDYAARVVESVETGHIISDTLFSFVCQLDRDDDPFDEAVWRKANPNLGISVKADYLREQANEAKHQPAKKNQFLRYHCNLQVTSRERAIDPVLWAACRRDLPPLEGRECYGGWDLGRTDDFAAVSLAFPEPTGKTEQDEDDESKRRPIHRYDVMSWSFTSEGALAEMQPPPFAGFRDHPRLFVSHGETVEFAAVRDRILYCHEVYAPRSWAYDATFAEQLAQELLNDHGLAVVKFVQSARHYNEPIRQLLKAVKEKRVGHDGDALLAWQMSNLIIKANWREEWMPDKPGSKNKIDAAVALLMAFGEGLLRPGQNTNWYYMDHDLEVG